MISNVLGVSELWHALTNHYLSSILVVEGELLDDILNCMNAQLSILSQFSTKNKYDGK